MLNGKAPLTTLPKWKAKQQPNNKPPSEENANFKNVAKRQHAKRNKKRKREQLPQRRRGEAEAQQEEEWYGEEDWGGRRVCLLLKVLLLLVQREWLDQLRRHRRDGQSVGLPVVRVLQPVDVVNLRLSTNKQLIPGCSNKLQLCI